MFSAKDVGTSQFTDNFHVEAVASRLEADLRLEAIAIRFLLLLEWRLSKRDLANLWHPLLW